MRATLIDACLRLFFLSSAFTFFGFKNNQDIDACSTPVHAPIQVHTHRLGAVHRLKE
jgi:hypothetical protein